MAGVATPFIIWFCIGYRDLFEPLIKKGEEGRYFCPVCGAEEEKLADIAKHIKTVHGKEAFRSKEVKDSFDTHPELARKRKKR